MTAYYCPRCKTKDHWANEACVSTRSESVGGESGPLPKFYDEHGKFDRLAYQREYMRRRRKKEREGRERI
jgi:hypothetical protein